MESTLTHQQTQADTAREPGDEPAEVVITVRDLTVAYDEQPAIEGISFTLRAGSKLAIIGPNGAGKSTLMKALMGLLRPQRGAEIVIAGGRDRLGYVPQHHEIDWSFPVTVYDVVMMGLTRRIGWFRRAGREHRAQVMQALERVGLADHADRPIDELSGGQRRRVFIARALAQHADILLLDEPFAGVDVHAQASMMSMIDQLNTEGLTLLLSTHDLGLAFRRFDQVMALNRELIGVGPAHELYTPEVLRRLYGGQLATWQDGQQVMIFIDEHRCE